MNAVTTKLRRIEAATRRIAGPTFRRLRFRSTEGIEMPRAEPFRFNEVLHALREAELYKLPRHKVFLSAGCSGSWYFDWIEKTCRPTRHVGIELFSPKPDVLPPNCEWIAASISAFPQVSDASIDIVFSGQNLEHLWPKDIVGFLLEAHRVLRVDGMLVVDTPNRAVTSPMGWAHLEHTAEFTVAELHHMFGLAGFRVDSTVGHWWCHDRDTGERFPLLPDPSRAREVVVGERISRGTAEPDDAFSIWIRATPDHAPDVVALRAYVDSIWTESNRERITRTTISPQCEIVGDDASVPATASGFVMWGPYVPLLAGRYQAIWRVRLDRSSTGAVATLDVASQAGVVCLASRPVDTTILPIGEWVELAVPFELAETTFGLEFRLASAGGHAFSMGRYVRIGSA